MVSYLDIACSRLSRSGSAYMLNLLLTYSIWQVYNKITSQFSYYYSDRSSRDDGSGSSNNKSNDNNRIEVLIAEQM